MSCPTTLTKSNSQIVIVRPSSELGCGCSHIVYAGFDLIVSRKRWTSRAGLRIVIDHHPRHPPLSPSRSLRFPELFVIARVSRRRLRQFKTGVQSSILPTSSSLAVCGPMVGLEIPALLHCTAFPESCDLSRRPKTWRCMHSFTDPHIPICLHS